MRTTHGVLALLAGIVGLGAVAYAAAPDDPTPRPTPTLERGGGNGPLPRPKITMHPDKLATTTSAKFGFAVRGRAPRFQCRLDGRSWTVCQAPVAFRRLTAGSHSFSVRVLAARGRHGKASSFRWRVLEPMNFSISPQLAGLGALYPGAPAQALPLTISNPNPVPIFVTSLTANATANPLGCPSVENLILIESSASSASPIKVPANGSLSLPGPAGAAPAIQLRDLPVSQDACQKVQFPLSFSGTARG